MLDGLGLGRGNMEGERKEEEIGMGFVATIEEELEVGLADGGELGAGGQGLRRGELDDRGEELRWCLWELGRSDDEREKESGTARGGDGFGLKVREAEELTLASVTLVAMTDSRRG